MRTKGAITKKECFNCKVICNGEILQDRNYITLKDVAKDLGMTYNQVVEITRGRKKIGKGKYDVKYDISKIKQNKETIEKIKDLEDEIKNECMDENGNIIDELLYESSQDQIKSLSVC